MATLGTLTLDLIAKIGGFTGELDKASRNTKKNADDMSKSIAGIGTAIGVLGATAVTGFAAIIASSVKSANELSQFSQVAGVTTTEFQKYAAGAKTVGVENDKLSDIFKDTSDKMGEFIALGSGGAKDFFDTIAPLVGVTADQFKRLNGPEALQLYVDSLQKANVNQSEMTFYLEAIASDSTKLLPLLRDGGKGFKEWGERAQEAGAILNDDTIAAAKAFSGEVSTLKLYVDSATTSLAAQFLPVIAAFTKDVADGAKEAGGLGNAVETASNKVLSAVAFIINAGDGIVRVFDTAGNLLVGLYATAAGRLAQLAAAGTGILSKLPGEAGAAYAKQNAEYKAAFDQNMAVAAQAAAAIKENTEKPLAGDALKQYVVDAKAAAADLAKLNTSAPLGGEGSVGAAAAAARKAAAAEAKQAAKDAEAANKKQMADAAAIAKQIDQNFKSSEQGYERQIELVGTVSEAKKLAFEIEKGNLVGINAEQQMRLEDLAKQLDVNEKLKTQQEAYNALVKDLRTDEEVLRDTALERFKTLEAMTNLPKADRDKAASRIAKDLTAEVPEGEGLAPEVGGALGEFDKLDKSEKKLEKWYAQQLAMLDEFRKTKADQQDTWDAEELSVKKQHEDALANIEKARQTAGLTTLGTFFGQLATLRESDSKKGRALGKAAAIAQATINAYTAATGAYASASAIPVVGWVLGPVAAAAALAAGLANVSAIQGMAHDGIDSVPQDGTWLLQKGERVTTAETSAKLDRTLDGLQMGGGGGTVNQNIYVQGQVSRQTRTQMANDAARSQRQAQKRVG